MSCTLDGVDAYDESIGTLALACDDGDHTFTFSYLHLGDSFEVPIGATVVLDAVACGGFSPFMFVAIRTATDPLFMGMAGSRAPRRPRPCC